MLFFFFSSLPAASLQKAVGSYYKNVSNAVPLDTKLAVLSVYTLSYDLLFIKSTPSVSFCRWLLPQDKAAFGTVKERTD